MKERELFIGYNGHIVSIGDPPLEMEGERSRKRVSNILPVNRFKRVAFLALRALFGERGRVAEWTRRWHGPWTSYLFATGETFTHQSRRVCVRWEHDKVSALLEQ